MSRKETRRKADDALITEVLSCQHLLSKKAASEHKAGHVQRHLPHMKEILIGGRKARVHKFGQVLPANMLKHNVYPIILRPENEDTKQIREVTK
jgi:hypothetical protein